MKILLLSDSHRCMERMERAILREQPHAICHMGDHLSDAKQLKTGSVPIYAVSGNCDYGVRDTPPVKTMTMDGALVMITHGHEFGVKRGLLTLELAARERGADVVVFGHTHMPVALEKDGFWMINPGSCSGIGPWSYGVLTINHGEISCEIVKMEE